VERIVERCAGPDVHKSSVTACVRIPDESGSLRQEIRGFATTTRGLLLLGDWLASFQVELVGMKATGVYWNPIYYVLEDDFELWILNARHLKGTSPAGRPTSRTPRGDLPAGGARAGAPQLRAAERDPGAQEPHPLPQGSRIEERTREVQLLEKVLQDAGIKLSCVATRVLGASARAFAQTRWSAGPPIRRSWRSWLGAPSLQAARAPGCSGGMILLASCPHGGQDTGPRRLPRRVHR